jgi:glyceraldehyde 3-phosphate dehydrogenase
MEVIAVNELNPDNAHIAYLLNYDSLYGPNAEQVVGQSTSLRIGEDEIVSHHDRDVVEVPWHRYNLDIIIDASGNSKNLASYEAIPGDVPVLVTYCPDPDQENAPEVIAKYGARVKPIIIGCNEADLRSDLKHRVFSSSICDAVALAPVAKLLMDNVGIESGHLTTLHPWLANQNLLDNAFGSFSRTDPGPLQSNYALGRCATENMIPKTTTALSAAAKVIPTIDRTIQTFSFRVPTTVVSAAVLVVNTRESTNAAQITKLFTSYEASQQFKIIRNVSEPLVSTDYRGSAYSAAIDQRWTAVAGDRHLRMMYWYDNEFGYSARVLDVACLIAEARARATRSSDPKPEPRPGGLDRRGVWA